MRDPKCIMVWMKWKWDEVMLEEVGDAEWRGEVLSKSSRQH